METEPLIERETNDTQPLTTADIADAAGARRQPIPDQITNRVKEGQ